MNQPAEPGPDPSNTEDPSTLVEPLDEDDDVYDLISAVDTESEQAPGDDADQ